MKGLSPRCGSEAQKIKSSTRAAPAVGKGSRFIAAASNFQKVATDISYLWARRQHERLLNEFEHFKTRVHDIGIHFIHQRGKGPTPFPLILTHGYPDSFYRFLKLIPPLTDPVSYGGRAEDAFDVVVPDLPGYGFSDKPAKHGSIFQVNNLWASLMRDKLGYRKFGAHGGDWGSTVTEQLARSHPGSVVAILLPAHTSATPRSICCGRHSPSAYRRNNRRFPSLAAPPANWA